MKNLFVLIVLIVFMSCLRNTTNSDETGEKKIETDLDIDCNPEDILILNNKNMKTAFFQKLDSVVAIQYPQTHKKKSVDISPELLNQFLSDLKINSLKSDFVFQKKYSVRPTPKNKEIRNESNTIELRYFPKDCTYRLSVKHYYETKEFSDEESVSYSFKIENGYITVFKRQEAG